MKIVDFGLARAVDDDSQLTGIGGIAGTPSYMSPEQARGTPLDERSDLFALGCVLYRMCTGQLPFRGATTLVTLRAVEEHQPAPPRELDPMIPADLSALVMRLLDKEPRRRLGSAQEVVDQLAAIDRQIATGHPSTACPAAPRHAVFARHRRLIWSLGSGAAILAVLAWLGGEARQPTHRPQAEAENAPVVRPQVAASHPAVAIPGQRPLAAEYAHNFRDAAFDPQRLLPLGFDSLYGFTLLKPEPEGLRITIPAHQSRQKPNIGFAPACEIRGDFQILAAYDLLSASPAKVGTGVGADLYVLPKGTQRGFVIRRCVLPPGQTLLPGAQQAFAIQFVVDDPAEGQKSQWKYFPAQSSSGWLCLARSGTTLHYRIAEGEQRPLRSLWEAQVGRGPIGLLRVAAVVDREEGALDMRWKELVIRAEELEWTDLRLFNPLPSPPRPTEKVKKSP